MKQIPYILVLSLLLFACGPRERVSKTVFDEVNSSMEAKKLSDAQITEEALVWGDSISTEAQAQFMESLQNAVQQGGFEGALAFCNLNSAPITEELNSKHGVTIRRTSNRARNMKNLPSEEELQILEAYEYNMENSIENEPNIQRIEGGEVLLYTKAIVISSEFCLACHGEPEKDINAHVLNKIDSLYQGDLARNFEVGDLRGMWSLRLPKKSVVNRL